MVVVDMICFNITITALCVGIVLSGGYHNVFSRSLCVIFLNVLYRIIGRVRVHFLFILLVAMCKIYWLE